MAEYSEGRRGKEDEEGEAATEEGLTVMTNPDHQHTPEEERRIREAALDETLADTFPASDPPSTIPNPDDDELIEGEPPEN